MSTRAEELKVGDTIMVDITRVLPSGEGLGTYKGRQIIVPNAFVGERVRAVVKVVTRDYVIAMR